MSSDHSKEIRDCLKLISVDVSAMRKLLEIQPKKHTSSQLLSNDASPGLLSAHHLAVPNHEIPVALSDQVSSHDESFASVESFVPDLDSNQPINLNSRTGQN